MPLLNDRFAKRHCDFLIEKVHKKLTAWKVKTLSLVGCCTLVQPVLLGVPSYAMQFVWLPQTTCNSLSRLNRNFLWSSSANHKCKIPHRKVEKI